MLETASQWDGLAHSTRYARCTALAYVLRILIREAGTAQGLDKQTPQVGKPAPRNTTATAEEKAKILGAAKPYMRCLIHLCSDLAIRSGTAEKICPRNYDPEENTLSFKTKYGRSVTLPVTKPLRELFALHAAEPDVPYVVALNPRTRTGRRPAHHRSWRALLKSVGIKRQLTFHDLRRTTAVRAYEATRDIRIVQAILGHKQLEHTVHYLDHNLTAVSLEVLEAVRTGTVQ